MRENAMEIAALLAVLAYLAATAPSRAKTPAWVAAIVLVAIRLWLIW